MGDWKDDKDKGSWPFIEQPTKLGYLNNPRWTPNKDSVQHIPCGHWHKGPLTTSSIKSVFQDFYQQSVTVLQSLGLFAVGAMVEDTDDGDYIISIYDSSENIIAAHIFESSEGVSGLPGTIKFLSVGNSKVFYSNWQELGDWPDTKYLFYTLDTNGNHTSSVIFTDLFTNSDNYILIDQSWYAKSFAVDSSGNIIFSVSVIERVAGVKSYFMYTFKSSDGINWNSVVKIPCEDHLTQSYIDVDSNNNFYVVVSDNASPSKAFRLWKSTDTGASWVEILTVPSTPISTSTDNSFVIYGTRLVFISRIFDSGYVNYLWYSDNGGVSWTRRTVTIDSGNTFIDIFLAINGNNFVFACKDRNTNIVYLINSTDAGVSWNNIGQVEPTLTWSDYDEQNTNFGVINNDINWFLYTSCGSHLNSSDNLAALFSVNNGSNFTEHKIPIARTDSDPTIVGGGTGLIDEPQIWKLPGE